MLENIYICRHGYRSNWEDESIDSGPTGHFHDPPLAQRGLVQAEHLGIFLSAAHPPPGVLFSSPFYRCLETITPLAQKTGLPVNVEPGVGEWFSLAPTASGLHARPKLPADLQPHVSIPLSDYAATLFPPRQGETIPQLRERCETFLSAWITRVEAEMPSVKTAAIMSHAALVIALGRILMNSEDHDVGSATASVSLYRRKSLPPLPGLEEVPHIPSKDSWAGHGTGAEVGEWVQLMNGETGYLPNGAERAWTMRDIMLNADGSVIDDPGDGREWTDADLLPVGLAESLRKYANPKANGHV